MEPKDIFVFIAGVTAIYYITEVLKVIALAMLGV